MYLLYTPQCLKSIRISVGSFVYGYNYLCIVYAIYRMVGILALEGGRKENCGLRAADTDLICFIGLL